MIQLLLPWWGYLLISLGITGVGGAIGAVIQYVANKKDFVIDGKRYKYQMIGRIKRHTRQNPSVVSSEITIASFDNLSRKDAEAFVKVNTTFNPDYKALLEDLHVNNTGEMLEYGVTADRHGNVYCIICDTSNHFTEQVIFHPCNDNICQNCDFKRILLVINARYDTKRANGEILDDAYASDEFQKLWTEVKAEMEDPANSNYHGEHITCHSCPGHIMTRRRLILDANADDDNAFTTVPICGGDH